MSKLDLLKKIAEYDGEVNMSDFSVDELEEMSSSKLSSKEKFKERYFEYYDDIKTPSKKKQDW